MGCVEAHPQARLGSNLHFVRGGGVIAMKTPGFLNIVKAG